MAQIKGLDLDGLKKLFGIVDEKISKNNETLNTEIDKKADKTELEGLASTTYVDGKIDEVKEEIVGTDLKDSLDTLETIKEWKEQHGSEYTNLLAEVQKKADAETVASTYATKSELEGYQEKGDYALKSDLSDFITEEDLPTFVPFSDEEIENAAKTE